MEEKIFVIFNTTNIGDVLVTNTLVQNIKYYYQDSKVVFVCKKQMGDVARYQSGVDDVVTMDKESINSFGKFLSFIKNFPYKKPFASFVTYSNERNLLISRLIGAKHIISHHKFKLWNTKEKYKLKEYTHMNDKWGGMIESLTNEHKKFAIKYQPPKVDTPILRQLEQLNKPVALSVTSNFKSKDMKVQDCAELIELLNQNGYTPVMTGAGAVASQYVIDLRKMGCFDFVDIVGCTSFVELAHALQICGGCISVDTGTMHFANALQVPVVGIFYVGEMEKWGSDTELYPAKILSNGNNNASSIFSAYKELIEA